MKTSYKVLLTAISAVLLSVVLVKAYADEGKLTTPPPAPLAIEIALSKAFYVPAATTGKSIFVVIRVPAANVKSQGQDAITALKLQPIMDGDKVKVTVVGLIGEPDRVKTCSDWDALKSRPIATYVAGLDEEVSLVELKDFGVSMGTNPLTFRVVPKRILSPVPDELPGGCDCGSCDNLICCPNPGYCLGCGSCGSFCCK